MKRFLTVILPLVVLGVLLLGGGFYFGYQGGLRMPETIIVKGISNIGDTDVKADFGVYWQARQLLKDGHIDGVKADDQKLIYGSIAGMVKELGDPNTIFFPPADAKKFEEDVSGSFGGIGAEIGIRKEQLVIVAPLKDTPAERAGLKSGDKILKIDDKDTADLNLDEAVKNIRGPVGTKVVLTMLLGDSEKSKEVPITREVIQIPTLKYSLLDGGIIRVELYSFNKNALPLFYDAMFQSLSSDTRGILLDLRNNPGGFLEAAVELAGWFLERGEVVVTEQFRSGNSEVFRAEGNGILKNFPVVLLVNGGSASASEILAGALRDNRGVKLVGEKTFGKGTVQELKTLSDDSTLKLTIARWVLPSGQILEGNGLTPDIEVAFTEKDAENDKDPQFEKALEALKEEIKNRWP